MILDIGPSDAHYTAITHDPIKAFVLVRIQDTTEFLVLAVASLPSRNHDTAHAQGHDHARDRHAIKAKAMSYALALILA